MLQRGGEVVIRMLEDVEQVTIGPLIERTNAEGTSVYTDEYGIYSRLEEWGYGHEMVCHAAGNTPGTTGMGSARCKSTRSKGSGRCSARGSVLIEGSRKKACRCTWDSSNTFTRSGPGARGCWER
jgi:transposase